jgi:exonuclease SbcC
VANEECELDRINKAQQELHQKLESRTRQRKEATALDEEIGLLAIRLRKIGENYVLEKKKLGLRSQSIVKELERLRKICARREEITARVDDLNRLREEASKLDLLERKAYEITQREAAARAAYQKECDVFQKNRAKLTRERDSFLSEEKILRKMLDQELAICEMDLERARQEAALIDTVACKTIEGIPEQCVLLSKAIGARKSLPDLERKILIIRSQEYAVSKGAAALQESIRVCEEKLAALEKSVPVFDEGKFQDERKDLGYDRTSHEYLRKEISAIEKKGWESLLDELKIAETLQSEKESSLAAIEEQLDELRVKFEKDLVEAEAVIGDKKARRLEIVIDEDLMDESSFDHQRAVAKKKLEQLRREEILFAGDLASARTKLDTLQTIEERTRQAEAEVIRLEQSITDWRLIQRACSKDGIPALELDAAGPAISHIANELLASSFGNRFQIRFETTRLSKDNKKQLETFDVRVYGEDGEKSIEELSGGERVWVERAIAEAIAIHLSLVSQHRFQTTFQDEADGPLDPENKQKYLAMLRESFRIGRRDFAFIVSQTPDIWQQVDQRIHLDPERSRIDYVCGG